MKIQNEELAFLEAQLQWVKRRDAILSQIENKLYEMKHLAEQVAADETFMLESKKQRLNERFLQLKNEVAELENQLRIFYN
ncbi:hypothetical protein AB1K09_03470 [Solibacillus silvestris]